MEIREIDELIQIFEDCGVGKFSYKCSDCPLKDSENCEGELYDRVLEALKRLKFLETPTNEEQPKLINS